MQFLDQGRISTRRITDEGYLHLDARIGRPGLQKYSPVDFRDEELPPWLRTKPEITILRPESEVFSKESMDSFRLNPITIEHPSSFVDAQNYKTHQVGVVDEVIKIDNDLGAHLVVQDSDAIRVIEAGKEQVSLGYSSEIEWFVDPKSNEMGIYDGVMKNIRGNHLAIVDRARAGSAYRLFDTAKELKETMSDIKIQDALMTENSVLKIAVSDAEATVASMQTKIADSEKRIAELAAELESAKKLVVSDSDLQGKIQSGVEERLAIVDSAKSVFPEVEIEGKTTNEIKLAVIDHLTGGVSKPDATDEKLIASLYDSVRAIVKSRSTEMMDAVVRTSTARQTQLTDSDKARERMIARRTGREAIQ